MIHWARSRVPPVAITIFTENLFCLEEFQKSNIILSKSQDGRTGGLTDYTSEMALNIVDRPSGSTSSAYLITVPTIPSL